LTGFGRILEDLNGAGVRYVLIGGIALIRHGVVRATRDIDAVFDPGQDDLDRIRLLVDRWGAGRPPFLGPSPVRVTGSNSPPP
jgi:hypothetical protein